MVQNNNFVRGLGGLNFTADQVALLMQFRDDFAIILESQNVAQIDPGVLQTDAYRDFLQGKSGPGESISGLGGPSYDAILPMPQDPATGEKLAQVDLAVYLWLAGAPRVNRSDGLFGEFIQEYTMIQYGFRSIGNDAAERAQTASNFIAFQAINDLAQNENLPDIIGLGIFDAGSAASEVFNGDYAPRAGTLLFPFLGADRYFQNWLLPEDGDGNVSTGQVSGSAGGENLIFKIKPGSYDLFTAIAASTQASLSSGVSNPWETLLELLPGLGAQLVQKDQAELIADKSDWFDRYYGVYDSPFKAGERLTLDKVGTFASNQVFEAGTSFDDNLIWAFEGLGDINFSARSINLGSGDDSFAVQSLSNEILAAYSLIHGDQGFITLLFDTLQPINVRVTAYENGAYESRIGMSLPNADSTSYLYGFEHIVFGRDGDTITIDTNEAIDIEGTLFDGGGSIEQGNLPDLSAAQDPVSAILEGMNDDPGSVQVGAHIFGLAQFEDLVTSSGDDTIAGSSLQNVFFAANWNDSLDGAGSHDDIYGGRGNDIFKGGEGADYIYDNGTATPIGENETRGAFTESFGTHHSGSFFSSRVLNTCAKANAALRGNNRTQTTSGGPCLDGGC